MLIHTLHVKNGLCMIIEHPNSNRKTLVDIHRLADSDLLEEKEVPNAAYLAESAGGYVSTATNPVEYWTSKLGYISAFRVILTHPDNDHVKGIKEFYDKVGMTNLWMPTSHRHTLPQNEDGKLINEIIDGKVAGVTFIEPKRGSDRPFFGMSNDDWDKIQILHPTTNHDAESSNGSSYLIKIHYGRSSVIIGGDAEQKTFEWLYEHYPNDLKCTLFIASHHGRQSGWPRREILQHMNPLMVIIPKGKIAPKDSALENYRLALGKDRFLTTSYAGNIRVKLNTMDGFNVFECSRPYVNDQLPDILESARRARGVQEIINCNK